MPEGFAKPWPSIAATDDLITDLLSNGFSIGTNTRVNDSGETYHYLAIAGSAVETGTYLGDGVDGRAISLSGEIGDPKYLTIANMTGGAAPAYRTDRNVGDETARYAPGLPHQTNYIQSLSSNEFTIGTDGTVNNAAAHVYAWLAIGSVSNIATGRYTGDGVDDRVINVGFTPKVIWVKADDNVGSPIRTSNLAISDAMSFDGTLVSNSIKSIVSNGFQLGTSNFVNAVAGDYLWVAFG